MKILVIVLIAGAIGALSNYFDSGGDKDSAIEGGIMAAGGCFATIVSLLMGIVPILLGILFLIWLFS